jgi:concanavalin A-like lectin/glucanase superfamily protein
LPPGIVSGLTSFSISAWCYLGDTAMSTRIFDFGSGTTTYMFLTPETLRFAITTTAFPGEQDIPSQNILGPPISQATWTHVVVPLAGTTGTLYFNGTAQPVNRAMTLSPASLGMTTSDWIGRGQYTADPYLNGKIDNFRIYNRALSPSEVTALYTMKL